MSLKSRLDEELSQHYVYNWNPDRLSQGEVAFATRFTGFVIGDLGYFVPQVEVRVFLGIKRAEDADDIEDRLRDVLGVINSVDDAYPQQLNTAISGNEVGNVPIHATVVVHGV